MTTSIAQDDDEAKPDRSLRGSGGQLKIFLGAAPGTGKTCAMLTAACELQRGGVDVVVGAINSHGRIAVQALIQGLETLPHRQVTLEHDLIELDLDAILVRRPTLAVIDELAHQNPPGHRHERRYQDIIELMEAGTDVVTTLNIQEVESLNDLVREITGIRVRNTVPDAVLDYARDIILVDVSPHELQERFRQGKVYIAEQDRSTLQAFFSLANLTALRDLAVQQIADRVDADMRGQMAARDGGLVPVRRRVVAAIDGFDNSEYLVRVTRKIAERRNAPWSVIFVDTGGIGAERQSMIEQCFALARRLSGECVMLQGDSVVNEILTHASRNAVSTIVIGRTRERPFARMFNRTLTQQLLQKGAHFELTIINTPFARAKARRILGGNAAKGSETVVEVAYATVAAGLATVVAAAAAHWLALHDLSLVFITAVLFVAVRTRMSVAVYAAMLCFLSYNFFFIPPRFTLYIFAGQGVITVAAFLVAALLCGRLANRLRTQILMLRAANAHTAGLKRLGQRLAAAVDESEVYRSATRVLRETLNVDVLTLAHDEATGQLAEVARNPKSAAFDASAFAAADWCFVHHRPAGYNTDTLQTVPWWCLPFMAGERTFGVVCFRFGEADVPLTPELTSLTQAMVQDLAQAVARTRLVEELEVARMQGETERLRSALLSSVSHDLRTPLSSIIGSAESLAVYRDKLSPDDQRVLAEGILGEGQRLDRYIQNLLDMTRLGHGSLDISRQWAAVDEIMGAALARLRKFAPGTSIELKLAPNLPLVQVHSALIEQALFNVLENAVKFSPSNAVVTIDAQMENGQLRIDVEDKGPGIPEEDRHRIFDMFYSVKRGDRARQGTGLGLTICQGMVAAHSGKVEAMPGADGRGTNIRITLPVSEPPLGHLGDE